eukprot:m.442794 g.442794  ORF g.442794 m.442794 type:complete len:78 (+) comp56817_c0_seq43:87-320(+)
MPNFVMYAAAVFDKRLTFSFLKMNLDKIQRVSSEKLKEQMGFQFHDFRDTLRATIESILAFGLVSRRTWLPLFVHFL